VPVVCANGDVLLRLRSLIGEDAVELPVGLDARIFSPEGPSVRTAFGWTSEHRVIGYVGRLTRLKGVDVLAQAFHELANAVPEARLLIVGAGEEEQALRHVLKQEILEGKVRVVPVRDPESLGACYRAIDVFVLPSRYENFSNALLEAAACGVPFIAADVGGNRIIQQIACGSLFAPGSAADLLLQMRESLADLQSRRNRALAVSQLVRDTYDWDASADRLEAILETRVVGTAIQDDAGMAVGKPITV
jgi:glycosyltransferase involved in cell wall biosynthesis